jgi:branched-chain amino acid transport system ATP-binding protein
MNRASHQAAQPVAKPIAGAAKEATGTPAEVLLRGHEITRRWGGLVAVDKVSIELQRGQVHAVIGTNGAGKSTLINILSGEIAPSSGQVELLGHDVTAWSQSRRARAGLGRSYQRNTIFTGFSVFENCRLSAQARHPKPWHWWQRADRCGPSSEAALSAVRKRWTARPVCFRTGRSASSKSPCAWPPNRRCCCWTNRWPAWAPRRPTACSSCWRN